MLNIVLSILALIVLVAAPVAAGLIYYPRGRRARRRHFYYAIISAGAADLLAIGCYHFWPYSQIVCILATVVVAIALAVNFRGLRSWQMWTSLGVGLVATFAFALVPFYIGTVGAMGVDGQIIATATEPVVVDETSQRFSAMQEQLTAAQAEVVSLRKELTVSKEAQVKGLQDEAAKLRKELQQTKSSLQSDLNSKVSTKESKDKAAEIAILRKELDGYKAEMVAVQGKVKGLESDRDHLKAALIGLLHNSEQVKQVTQFFLLREDPHSGPRIKKLDVRYTDITWATKAVLLHDEMNQLIKDGALGPLEYRGGKVLFNGQMLLPVRTSKLVLLNEE